MAEIPDSLLSLFTSKVEERDGKYIIEVPKSEIENGVIDPSTPQRVAILEGQAREKPDQTETDQQDHSSEQSNQQDGPPVSEGERRTLLIGDIGDQGDGIARVERGYVVIVPDTKPEDVVEVEIENVQENVAFAEVIEHKESAAEQR